MPANLTNPLDKPTSYSLLVMAVVQGYLLYFLHLSIDNDVWPATDMRWLAALYTLFIALPLFFYFGITRLKDWRNVYAGIPLALLLFWLGWHLGWLIGDEKTLQEDYLGNMLFPFVASLGTALFILVFLFRGWTAENSFRLEYTRLLGISWQNALAFGLLLLFIAVFRLLLFLWGQLFEIVNVGFFAELFTEPAFNYPVTFLVAGMGLLLIRNRVKMIATVQFICEVLIKALLPLIALIVALFLLALPFTGIQGIWEAGFGSSLLMVLSLLTLFFFNAVLSGNKDEPPYPAFLRWFVLGVMVILPVISALVIWALSVRIEQYGLSVSRLWAVVIQFFITAYVLTYAVLILWRRRNFVASLQKANIVLACVVAGALLLVNTPIIDLHKISASNQVGRLLAGITKPADFDVMYLRFDLGRPGNQALKELQKAPFIEKHTALQNKIANALTQTDRWATPSTINKKNPEEIAKKLKLVPKTAKPPEALLLWLANKEAILNSCFISDAEPCHLIRLDDLTEQPAWALYTGYAYTSNVFIATNDSKPGWKDIGILKIIDCKTDDCEKPKVKNETALYRPDKNHLIYTDGNCYFIFEPTLDFYLKNLQVQIEKP